MPWATRSCTIYKVMKIVGCSTSAEKLYSKWEGHKGWLASTTDWMNHLYAKETAWSFGEFTLRHSRSGSEKFPTQNRVQRGSRGPVSQERLSQSSMQERSKILWVLKQYGDPTKACEGNLSWEVFTAFWPFIPKPCQISVKMCTRKTLKAIQLFWKFIILQHYFILKSCAKNGETSAISGIGTDLPYQNITTTSTI